MMYSRLPKTNCNIFSNKLTAGNLIKIKIYIHIYVCSMNINRLIAHFPLTLPLSRQCFFLLLFFSVFFSNFFKPNLFDQCLFKSLRKQQLRRILLNMYVFKLISFNKLCSHLATCFSISINEKVNSQEYSACNFTHKMKFVGIFQILC